MTNAQKELLEHIEGLGEVKFIKILRGKGWKEQPDYFEGTLTEVLPLLNFTYDSGYGGQNLFGYIWYTDGTWSERGEYDGSEWWEHKEVPPQDVSLEAFGHFGV
jgi:hypothetical protein